MLRGCEGATHDEWLCPCLVPRRNTYSVLNALAGHYNSFGATAPIPKKRLERVLKVRAWAGHGLRKGQMAGALGWLAVRANDASGGFGKEVLLPPVARQEGWAKRGCGVRAWGPCMFLACKCVSARHW